MAITTNSEITGEGGGGGTDLTAVNAAISALQTGKSDTGHSHAIAAVTGLQAALDALDAEKLGADLAQAITATQTAALGTDQIPAVRGGVPYMATAAQLAALASGGGTQMVKMLACPSAAPALTGGTVGVKTVLWQVDLPDGFFNSVSSRIVIDSLFWYIRNTNSKAFGVDIGLTAGAPITTLFSRTRTSATHGADSFQIIIRRHWNGTQLVATVGDGGVNYIGAQTVNSATPYLTINTSPNTAGLKLFFWGRLDTANTDFVQATEIAVRSEEVL